MENDLLPLRLDVIKIASAPPPPQNELVQIMEGVFKRDNYCCRYCGLYSPTHGALELDHMDGDHGNYDPQNLVTACHWCHGCHHLEFCLAAGATLVQWDYPQSAVSRLTQLVTSQGSLYENYNSLISEGARRREHNYPGGELITIVNELPVLRRRGEHEKVDHILGLMDAESIRLTYPTHLYLSAVQTIPGVSKDAWKQFRRYYLAYVNAIIDDSDIRSKVHTAWKEIHER